MKLKAFTVSAALSLAALAAPAHAAYMATNNGSNGTPYAFGKNGNGNFGDAEFEAGAFKDTFSFTLAKKGTESVNLSYFGSGFKSLMAMFNGQSITFLPQKDGSFFGSLSLPVTANSKQTLVVSGVAANDSAAYSGNLRFAGAVPEPASWALMIMGLGVAGTMRRRRTTVAANLA